ncbi:MAG: ABC transporter ATP-binding protein [Pseudomonadota bacterium]
MAEPATPDPSDETDNRPAVWAQSVALTLPSDAGPVRILQGASLDLPRGASIGVTGRSGSGKSSFLSVIAGLERPTAGSVHVLGQNLGALDEDGLAAFRGQHIGIVFQAFHLIPTMTALENAALPLELQGAADAFDRARDQLAAVGLAERTGHYPHQLSGGEQQRVAIARATVHGPALLLADEPTGNLDAAASEAATALLFEAQQRAGASLLLITHDAQLAERCDAAVEMADGVLAAPQIGAHQGAAPPAAERRAPPIAAAS